MRIFLAIVVVLLVGCVQAPTQSVELAVTVGRDIEKMHSAHTQTISILYSRMRADVNEFIDDVYMPYAIKEAIKKDRIRQASGKTSFIDMISKGLSASSSSKQQELAIGAMEVLVSQVTQSVDRQRKLLLDNLNGQERDLLASTNRSYLAIHQANSIVTGHLSSIAKVHETQNELLSEIGIETDVNNFIATKLAIASDEIAELTNKSQKELDDIGGVEGAKEKLQNAIEKLNIK
ncbi:MULTISPECIES: hypothetical protein [Vibrio]|nr:MULTISPECIES: hypothetical protein [Vibrio]OEF75569.1 hypothetical protein OA5_05380 [Vibrio cyclitrophicus 1F111]PMN21171.1 hypothetical protein BCT41_22785 [Vibrio splendidus]UQV24820.1 hypothetical protein M4S28_26125 [Vibrio sp. J383]